MRAMQDTGLKWLGKIPADWLLTKIGGLYSVRNEKVSDKDYPPLSVTNKGVLPQLDTAAKTNDGDNRKLVRIGDFAINSRSDRRGSCGISPYDGSVSLINIVMMPRKAMVPTYYEWLFHTTQFGDENYRWGHGIVDDLWTTGWQEMKKITIPMPPIDEQERIASFLTAKCTEIDALIADIQTQIDVLEQYKRSIITETVTKGMNPDATMKDSGIQWIGTMPSHWKCIRGKYILKYIQKPIREDDGVITCFRDGEVTLRSNRREDGFTMADKEIGYQGIDIGDLVVHGMDGFAGAIGISDSRGKASPVLNVLDTEQNKRYIMYFLRSMAYSDVFLAMATGIRVRSCDLRWNKLAELFYPVPPIEEQETIVEYIDSVLAKANDVIAAKKEQLSVLEAYKKSLIFEYVTGKKEVPAPITAVMVDPNVILLGKLPKLLSQQKGKIYNQKVLYLLNTYLGLNLGVQYYRYKHGPYDIMLDSYIDTLVENGWCVKTIKNGAENLEIGPNYDAFEEKYGSYFSEYDAEIKNFIQFAQPMKRSQIERVATLFAVWNDMILDGNSTPTDAEIVSDVMSGWTENKANFAYDTWLGTLNKMRTNGIIPKGQGLHTLPRDC